MIYITSRCKYCGSKKQQVLFSVSHCIPRQSFQLIQCDICNLVTLHPFLMHQQIYSRYYQTYRSPSTGQRFSFLLDHLMKFWRYLRATRMKRLCKKGPVLDIGCGQGIELLILKKAGVAVYGLEYDKYYANTITAYTGVKIYHGKLKQIVKPKNGFGLISFLHSLEHIPEALTYLKQARQLLRKGGYLVISVPNFSSLEASLFGSAWFHLDIPRHLYFFTEAWLINYLQILGFRLKWKKHIAPEYDFYSLLQSELNKLFPQKPNLLYRVLLKEEKKRRQDYLDLMPQLPAIMALSILALILTPLLWLIGASGTIELVFQKRT